MYVWCVSVVPTAAPSFTLSGPVPVVSGLLPGIGPQQFNPLQFSIAFAIGSGLSQTPTFSIVPPLTPNVVVAQVFATNNPVSYAIASGNSSGFFKLTNDAQLRISNGDGSGNGQPGFGPVPPIGIYTLLITATNIYGTGSAVFTIRVSAGVPSYLTLPWERPRMPRGFPTHLQPHQPHVPPATPNITSANVTVSLPVTSDELILATTITNTPLTVVANNILTPGIISVNGVPVGSGTDFSSDFNNDFGPSGAPYYFEIYGTKNLRTANASLGGLIPPPGVYNLKIQPANAIGRGNIGNFQVTVPVGAVPVITNNSANFTDTPPPVAGTVINTMSATQNPTSWTITAGDPNGNFQIANVNSAAGTCDIQITAAGVTNTTNQNTTQTLTMRANNASGQSAPGTDTISYQPASTGWTVLTQAAGSRTMYVSSVSGNNGTAVINDITHPYATIAAAAAQLRTGNSDWVLLKKGETWTNDGVGVITKSGISASQPILLGAYGSGARPLVKIDSGFAASFGGIFWRPTGDFTALVGIELYAYTRDPNNAAFNPTDANDGTDHPVGAFTNPLFYLNPFTFHLIEDCKLSFFNGNVVAEPQNAPWGGTFSMRRNVITDSYNPNFFTTGHNQGLFIQDIVTMNIEENFWDHNGWLDLQSTVGITIASPGVVTWNTGGFPFINGNVVVLTTTGTLPTGLSTNTNYFVVNVNAGARTFRLSATSGGPAINTSGGQSGTHTGYWANVFPNTFNRNVYVDTVQGDLAGAVCNFVRNITTNSASDGVQNRAGGRTWDNLAVQNTLGISMGAQGSGTYTAGISSGAMQNNVVLNSVDRKDVPTQPQGGGLYLSNCHTANCFASNNIISHGATASPHFNEIAIEFDPFCAGASATNNIIYLWNQGVMVDAGATGITTTPNTVDLAGANNQGAPEPFPFPNRNIQSYSLSIGGAGTIADFLAKCRAQSRDTYDTRYTANAINNYIRAGFNQSAVPATP